MRWRVLREDEPGVWSPITDIVSDAFLDDPGQVSFWNDGFADDWSDWGDDESNAISTKQAQWQSEDASNRSFACDWVP